MLIACPECGGRYSLDEEQDDIETPNINSTTPNVRESCDMSDNLG